MHESVPETRNCLSGVVTVRIGCRADIAVRQLRAITSERTSGHGSRALQVTLAGTRTPHESSHALPNPVAGKILFKKCLILLGLVRKAESASAIGVTADIGKPLIVPLLSHALEQSDAHA